MTYRLKITRINGKEYASIVENIYVKRLRGSTSRTVRCCGVLIQLRQSNPNFDNELQHEVQRLNAESVDTASPDKFPHTQKISADALRTVNQVNLGIVFYRKIWNLLEMPALLRQITFSENADNHFELDLSVFLLAAERILRPKCVLETFQSRDKLIFDFSKLSIDNIKECFDVLSTKKHSIIAHLNKISQSLVPKTEKFAYFDSADIGCASVDKHASKEKSDSFSKNQLTLCTFIDENGIPKDYEVLQLNTEAIVSMHFPSENSELTRQHEASAIVVNGKLCKKGSDVKNSDQISSTESADEQIYDIGFWDGCITNCGLADFVMFKSVQPEKPSELTHPNYIFWSPQQQSLDMKIHHYRLQRSLQLPRKRTEFSTSSSFPSISASALLDNDLNLSNIEHAGFCTVYRSESLSKALDIYKKYLSWLSMRVKMDEVNFSSISCISQEMLFRGNLLISHLSLVMQSLGNYFIQKSNIMLSNQEIIDLLRRESILIMKDKRTQQSFYIRQGLSTNVEKNREHAKLIDELLSVVGIEPIDTVEDNSGLMQKLNLSTDISLSA